MKAARVGLVAAFKAVDSFHCIQQLQRSYLCSQTPKQENHGPWCTALPQSILIPRALFRVVAASFHLGRRVHCCDNRVSTASCGEGEDWLLGKASFEFVWAFQLGRRVQLSRIDVRQWEERVEICFWAWRVPSFGREFRVGVASLELGRRVPCLRCDFSSVEKRSTKRKVRHFSGE